MANLPIGTILLIIVALLIYFGLAHRILDRMRLTDKGALVVLALIILGSFITVPISRGLVGVDINVGGALIPVGLAIYVLSRAGTSKEVFRALTAALITAVAVTYTGKFIGGAEPEKMFIDPIYFYPLVAGTVAYVISRSRRSAFIAGVLGMFLFDLGSLVWYLSLGRTGFVAFGGAGALDAYVIAGVVAALLAEIVGETRERLQGGPDRRGRPKELLEGLKKPEFANMLRPRAVQDNQENIKQGGGEHENK
ncbi:MAG: DUF1614 domain-containing protein [Carboxydocellales bacterium]